MVGQGKRKPWARTDSSHAIEPHHRRFAARPASEHGCWVTLPIYPRAPRYDSSTILPVVERSYHAVRRTQGPRTAFLAGDSAGAALALAAAQRLRPAGCPRTRARSRSAACTAPSPPVGSSIRSPHAHSSSAA
ncbi:alpha/beta hydrolase fold domain-containing protein [Sciscionella marina]|uniref:alpha/beta hydrolase fold domain-containing protein n=1 Tax=Sciscionella marina TaxID=508770 RepID=UPI000A06143A